MMPKNAPAQGKVPVLECVREGFGFLARDWRQILPVALLGALGLAPAEVWADTAERASDGGGRLMAMALGVLVQIPVLAAFYRRALSRGSAPLVLRLGGDEFRLAGVTAGIGLVVLIALLGGIMVVSMVIAMFASQSGADLESLQNLPTMEAARRFGEVLGAEGQALLMVLMLALAGFLLWLSARLGVAYAASVEEQRIRLFSTWSWTKGNAWPVAASLVLTLLIGLLLSMAAFLLPGAVLAGVFGQTAIQTPGSMAHWIYSYLIGATGLFFFHAPYAATTAYLYRGLKPASGE
jgi:hypothetical protein